LSRAVLEPYRIKMVEPIRLTSRNEREALLQEAHYNMFLLPAEAVTVDLLTDSGTNSLSAEQWAALMIADESYAGSRSFARFEETVRDVFGYTYVFPTHQGRGAERLLISVMCKAGDLVPNNTHFDTTRANLTDFGVECADLLCAEGMDLQLRHPFKGNMDVEALRTLLREKRERVPMVLLTITNNSGGSQPVAMANIRAVSAACREFGVPFYFDACRFAENAYYIRQRENGYSGKSIEEIVREMFSYGDGLILSGKKDALSNIGGLLCTNNGALVPRLRERLVLTEGFPTYGGMAGRDLEVMRVGLREGMDANYLAHRLGMTEYLGARLREQGIPIAEPAGGSSVFLDARGFLPHLKLEQLPASALAAEIYLEGGVRTVEIGSAKLSSGETMSLVRLCLPRRVYSQTQLDYVADVIGDVWKRRNEIGGLEYEFKPEILPAFSAYYRPLSAVVEQELATAD